MRVDEHPAYGAQADHPGWEPRARRAPRSVPSAPVDGRAMTALRAAAYITTSAASVVFIALVVYVGIELHQLRTALGEMFGGFGTPPATAPVVPGELGSWEGDTYTGDDPLTQRCFADPELPECAGGN